MIQAPGLGLAFRFLRKKHRFHPRPVTIAISVLCVAMLPAQNLAANESQAKVSLRDSLARADSKQTELHIFYVHGIGINPPDPKHHPQDFETSLEFRTTFCKRVRCLLPPREQKGTTYYADKHDFDHTKESWPSLYYLGEQIWRNKKDWLAAAPFVVNYKLDRKKLDGTEGAPIYLHEINWWPLVLSAKCRQIIAKESALVEHDEIHTDVCSAPTSDTNADGRYTSYTWVPRDSFLQRPPHWPKATPFNRWLKHDIMDWSFSDAVLAVGPLHNFMLEGIRETILQSLEPFHPEENPKQEFIIVSHSIGSYLMFSALDLPADTKAATKNPEWIPKMDDFLTKTSHAYFMANQIALLELANLDEDARGELKKHLERWIERRKLVQEPEQPKQPAIVAFSDPDDLLTWKVPGLVGTPNANGDCIAVTNLPAINASRWWSLWTFANPESAHIYYDKNKHVIQAMVPKKSEEAPAPCEVPIYP
jgi:hypothetical protein